MNIYILDLSGSETKPSLNHVYVDIFVHLRVHVITTRKCIKLDGLNLVRTGA